MLRILLATNTELLVVILKVSCSRVRPVHISCVLIGTRIQWIPSHGVERRLPPVEIALRDETCTADNRFGRWIPAHLLRIACTREYRIVVICTNTVHVVVLLAAGRDVCVGVKSHCFSKRTLAVASLMYSMGDYIDFVNAVRLGCIQVRTALVV